MAMDPLTAGLGLASSVIEKIWPNKSEQERAELAAAVSLVQGQLEVNRAEAASSSVFVAGWRPAVGWCCVAACSWNWIGLPVAMLVVHLLEAPPIPLKPADLTEMWPVLLGMLGLGGLRSLEKIKGAEGNR